MAWYGHPAPLGPQHPWHDPFAPQPLGSELPPEWAINAPGAPRPEDFPFTAEGRTAYYAAVESAAQQQAMMLYHAMHHWRTVEAERAAATAAAAEADAQRRRAALLLLMP